MLAIFKQGLCLQLAFALWKENLLFWRNLFLFLLTFPLVRFLLQYFGFDFFASLFDHLLIVWLILFHHFGFRHLLQIIVNIFFIFDTFIDLFLSSEVLLPTHRYLFTDWRQKQLAFVLIGWRKHFVSHWLFNWIFFMPLLVVVSSWLIDWWNGYVVSIN